MRAIIYGLICIFMFIIYLKLIKNSEKFKNIKQIIFFSSIVGIIFLIFLPNTSRDVYYYMGSGRVIDKYGENPYLVTIRRFRK